MTDTRSRMQKINSRINIGSGVLFAGGMLGAAAYAYGPSVIESFREAKADLLHQEAKTYALVDMDYDGKTLKLTGVDPETRKDTLRETIHPLNAAPEHNRVTNDYIGQADGYIQPDSDEHGKILSIDKLDKTWKSYDQPHVVVSFDINKNDTTLQRKLQTAFHVPNGTYKNLQGAFFYKE